MRKASFPIYRSASSCLQTLLMMSEICMHKLEICKYWYPSMKRSFFDKIYGFGNVTVVFKKCRKGEIFRKNLGKLWTVFPSQISFMGRNIPYKVVGKVKVMLLYHLSRWLLRMWNLFCNCLFVHINIFLIYLMEVK